ncbi:DNA damage-regulated autophagy modulator protein 1 isoform X1 [Phycodurus eques]|uniref:DNA damage-regulated autophagy modulator protein 1 isoform X1 n=1 Tax=Phycodurus eques TaxID=693459 RepID=UPI002ACE24B3|nr:DNA damage-regulated autophagy modulator protein 1 isoform X1 [Phycodurus eques]
MRGFRPTAAMYTTYSSRFYIYFFWLIIHVVDSLDVRYRSHRTACHSFSVTRSRNQRSQRSFVFIMRSLGHKRLASAFGGKRKANENGLRPQKTKTAPACVRAGMATVYSRFKFVEKLSEAASARLNKTSLVLGMLACLGMCVVATFQETTVTAVHDIGALLFFVSGVLYILLQSVISYRAFPCSSSAAVCRARLAVAVVASLAFFPTVICAFFVKQMDLHRDTGSKDYPFHMASAVCEWIVAFSFICFFLTYIDDFKLFTLRVKAELL